MSEINLSLYSPFIQYSFNNDGHATLTHTQKKIQVFISLYIFIGFLTCSRTRKVFVRAQLNEHDYERKNRSKKERTDGRSIGYIYRRKLVICQRTKTNQLHVGWGGAATAEGDLDTEPPP